eukprot:g2304.t1
MTVRLCILAIAGGAPPGASAERKFLAPRNTGDFLSADVPGGAPPDPPKVHADEAAGLSFVEHVRESVRRRVTSWWGTKDEDRPKTIHYPRPSGNEEIEEAFSQQKLDEAKNSKEEKVFMREKVEVPDATSPDGLTTAKLEYYSYKKFEWDGEALWSNYKLSAHLKGVLNRFLDPDEEDEDEEEKPKILSEERPLFLYEGQVFIPTGIADDPRKFPVPKGVGKISYAHGMIKEFVGTCEATSASGGSIPLPSAVPTTKKPPGNDPGERNAASTITYNSGKDLQDDQWINLTEYEGPVAFDKILWRPVPDPNAWNKHPEMKLKLWSENEKDTKICKVLISAAIKNFLKYDEETDVLQFDKEKCSKFRTDSAYGGAGSPVEAGGRLTGGYQPLIPKLLSTCCMASRLRGKGWCTWEAHS